MGRIIGHAGDFFQALEKSAGPFSHAWKTLAPSAGGGNYACMRTTFLVCFWLTAAASAAPTNWTVFVANDNCPDYTWGFTEDQTRQAFADVVRGHLDRMNAEGDLPEAERDRYNMAVTQEAMCFIERYPDRADELARRVREGRIYVSPFLCNTLWAFQGAEGFLRSLYPARRLSAQWNVPLDTAHHIELPSLPWGTASLLAGSGISRLTVPFYNFDGTWNNLQVPPVFRWRGPDGVALLVALDAWLSLRHSYMQGAAALREPAKVTREWLPHYAALGTNYPVRAILASGTHGDINPHSGQQTVGFAEQLRRCNASDGPALFVNATLPMFWKAIESDRGRWPEVSGDFGHAWDCWPVSLATYASQMRAGERELLSAEALLATVGRGSADSIRAIQEQRTRAEWCRAMLPDHAWNGTDRTNRNINANLRKAWAAELRQRTTALEDAGWAAAGLEPDDNTITIFNPCGFARRELICLPYSGPQRFLSSDPDYDSHTYRTGQKVKVVSWDAKTYLLVQEITENGHEKICFYTPKIPAYGFLQLHFIRPGGYSIDIGADKLGTYDFALHLDAGSNVVSITSPGRDNRELGQQGQPFASTTFQHGGQSVTCTNWQARMLDEGICIKRWQFCGSAEGLVLTNIVTLYTEANRLDFDFHIVKRVTSDEQRLVHQFPFADAEALIETTGALLRPQLQPEGDLLPGADQRRFCVQGWVHAGAPGKGITLVPRDSFLWRADLGTFAFEALGNDQNYKEVSHDQHGETRFRYSLRADDASDGAADFVRFSRSVQQPLLVRRGRLRKQPTPPLQTEATRFIVQCFKPADDPVAGGCIVRLWETAGRSGPVTLSVPGFTKAARCDLIERDQEPLTIKDGCVSLPLAAHGFAAIRLLRE
ncbi:MAG: hypothetical protein NTY53_26895 [Kiritimatiellaeota bacterium]|nr:hypothetical protein [Kiritimatiellota bacterium]